MSINLIVGGKITKTSKGDTTIEALEGKIDSYAALHNHWGGKQGTVHHEYTPPEPKPIDETKDFISAWWSIDPEGKIRVEYDTSDNKGFRAHLESTVYFQLKVNKKVPVGTKIKIKLWDYDSAFFMDWANLDDDDFGKDGKELFKTGTVTDVGDEEFNRITVKLYLRPEWKEQLKEDKGAFKDGCLDFYWTWEYKNIQWNSEKIKLRVYPSEFKLRIKPAYEFKNNPLPEIYSHKGDVILYAISNLPNGDIKNFLVIKIRTTTIFTSVQGINKFKKEIYTENINLGRNKLQSASYEVKEMEHFFVVKDNVKQIYIDEELIKIPVGRGSKIAIRNSVTKLIKFAKEAAKAYETIAVLTEFKEMLPILSSNGEFNKPSLSTLVAFIPGADLIAVGFFVAELTLADAYLESNKILEDALWASWQNAKAKGLEAAKRFIQNYWARDKEFEEIPVGQTTLDKLLKGGFKTIEELKKDRFENNSEKDINFSVFIYKIKDEELDNYTHIVDCIFLND
jgi:hypothetical protein